VDQDVGGWCEIDYSPVAWRNLTGQETPSFGCLAIAAEIVTPPGRQKTFLGWEKDSVGHTRSPESFSANGQPASYHHDYQVRYTMSTPVVRPFSLAKPSGPIPPGGKLGLAKEKAMPSYVKRIVDASFHRNGICGEGFWAILFEDDEGHMKFAAMFDEPMYCAVVQVDKLAAGDIAFGSNSYRGDNFDVELRPLLETWLEKNQSNRLGPFAIPPGGFKL